MMRFLLAIFIYILSLCAHAEEKFITVASTTSTQNSGLYDYLLPLFTKKTGIEVRVIAVGTGQAIKIAQNGDADVLLVHHRPSEEAFVAAGYGIARHDVMYNDFVLIGPPDEPIAKIDTLADILKTFVKTGEYLFISRSDDSGTHKKEHTLWRMYDLAPNDAWYREIGAGMGAALNMASALGAYTLSDRGTWLAFGNKRGLEIVWEGDPILYNPYGIILVNPEKHPHVKRAEAQMFLDWILSDAGQAAIGAFTVQDMQLFCPNAIQTQDTNNMCPSSALQN